MDALAKGEHSDPYHLFGGHPYHQRDKKEVVIRLFTRMPIGMTFSTMFCG